MAANSVLMAAALTQAQLMAAAGRSFHNENPPGCESVCYVPYFWPANVLGENLANHVPQFITDGHRVNVGIFVHGCSPSRFVLNAQTTGDGGERRAHKQNRRSPKKEALDP